VVALVVTLPGFRGVAHSCTLLFLLPSSVFLFSSCLLYPRPSPNPPTLNLACLCSQVVQGRLKWFDVEGPIVSRAYQFLSDGHVGYNQARKITEVGGNRHAAAAQPSPLSNSIRIFPPQPLLRFVLCSPFLTPAPTPQVPFPFHYAQLTTALLVVYTATVPVVVAAWLPSAFFAASFAFACVW